jgi:prepilin-type N-terminal cleavage/methylation domain-containing protein
MSGSQPSGFSYIEVLVVLGLLAILALTALPQLAVAVPDSLQVAQVARQIATDLRRAQELSIAMRNVCCRGAPCSTADSFYSLQFSPATPPYTSYTLYKGCDSTQVEPDFPKTIPSGITVSGRQTFCFRTGGYMVDVCLTGTTGTDGSVTVSTGAASATVWVYWYNGRVKVVGP